MEWRWCWQRGPNSLSLCFRRSIIKRAVYTRGRGVGVGWCRVQVVVQSADTLSSHIQRYLGLINMGECPFCVTSCAQEIVKIKVRIQASTPQKSPILRFFQHYFSRLNLGMCRNVSVCVQMQIMDTNDVRRGS